MLQVSLFGEQAITDDGTGRVRTRSSRSAALIGFLVLHPGSPQARQRIAGLFWPDSTEAQALTNLRRELHQLRQVLGDEPSLLVTSRDLCWQDTPTCRVDVRTFDLERQATQAAGHSEQQVLTHAARALAQYKGDFLPGAYDDWLLEARAELERQCVELCDRLSQAQAATGDLAGAVRSARRRITLQPLEETGYRTLMRLQASLGDRAGALSTYHHCASVLERELGVTPDPATRQAVAGLLARSEPAPAAGPGATPAAGRSGRAGPLVGRSREISLLTDLWRSTADGHPALALVRGDAGVGKTRLIAEIAGMARLQGAVVASTQCFGTSGRLAMAPVADWLRNPAVQAAAGELDPAWRTEVDRLVPAQGHEEPAAGSGVMADAWQHHRFFEGLARALLSAARPMLLVLDNLQWCDQETLAFMTFCLGLDPAARVLVVGSLRDDSPDEDRELAGWITRMRASGLLTELSLSPLESADTARLAEAISGRPLPEADVQLLQATTGGFPLYVTEAVRDGVDQGAASLPGGDLAAVLRSRLSHPSSAVQEVTDLAAAVGTNFTLDLLTEASDLDADVVVEAVDELWRRRIVREFRDGYDFSHELLRETAYAQISPPKRWLLHRRVAQGLELLHADEADGVSAQLADQYARGGRPARAVSYYRRAADIAADRFAHAESIRLHRRALSVVLAQPPGRDRDSRELELLEAMAPPLNARFGYASPDLEQALERAVALGESLGRKNSTLTAMAALSATRFVQGRIADGYQIAVRTLALAGPDSEQSGPARFVVGCSGVSLGRPAEAVLHFEFASRLASGTVPMSTGQRPDVHATAYAAYAHWLLGHDEEARSSCRRALALARSIDHPYMLAIALGYASMLHQMRGDLPALRKALAELRELCERYSFAYYREWVLILDGWSRGDGAGLQLVRLGIDNLKASGSLTRMPYWLSLLADLQARSGRADAARATLDAALTTGRVHDDLWWLPEVMRMRARYDEGDAAIARLRSAVQLATAHGSIALVQRGQRDLAGRS
ncbi:MAG TPA: AAA family ATPase [Streptosporangiaceae bacterium]|jgi:DNA-binding SARP family transcriptional activator/tetratricopeptide (TPR) repeat protein